MKTGKNKACSGDQAQRSKLGRGTGVPLAPADLTAAANTEGLPSANPKEHV